jgi:hypothetical protein
MDLPIGTRVQALRDPEYGPGPWPAEPTGRVAAGPEVVGGRHGPMNTYWVTFDEPQFDTDGSGPYVSSQILEKYLRILDVDEG